MRLRSTFSRCDLSRLGLPYASLVQRRADAYQQRADVTQMSGEIKKARGVSRTQAVNDVETSRAW